MLPILIVHLYSLIFLMTMETNNVIKYNKAEFPKLSSYNARLQTYLDLEWPIGLAQVPEVLAKSGFFILVKVIRFAVSNVV